MNRLVRNGPDVTVLGGGVVGVTAAVVLELAGYDTHVYTAEVPFEGDGGPTLATTYAAASVLPAYVGMEDLPRVFERSQAAFRLLAETGSMGVRRQPHFQLSGVEVADPEVAEFLDGFQRLETVEEHPTPAGRDEVHGWRADICFVETPTYLRRCYALYRALGGRVEREKVDRDGLADLPGAVLVNCTGLRAPTLFDDPRPVEAHVGHQVLAGGLPPIRGPDGRPFSVSYAPAPAEVVGPPGGLYAYPRTDTLVLGGTRIPADVAPGEDWDGEIDGPTRTIDGVTVPARIVDGNADLLSSYADVDLAEADLTARYGYRPVRDPDGEGVRIEREELDGRPVVHDYGHGGAGVTLSWGSAERVASLVGEVVEPDPRPVDVPPAFAVAEPLAELIRA